MDSDSLIASQDDNEPGTPDQRQIAYRQSQQLLTPAMAAFCEHWVLYHNQIKAYQFAYPRASVCTARAEARRLFADPRIRAEIHRVAERYVDHNRSTLMQAEQVLSRLAHADVRRLYDSNGVLLPPHLWDPDTAAAVASYTETTVKGVVTRKVRLHDKHAAARTLMEAKGAFAKDKTPPGIQASFIINMGNGRGPVTLGAASGQAGCTIEGKRTP